MVVAHSTNSWNGLKSVNRQMREYVQMGADVQYAFSVRIPYDSNIPAPQTVMTVDSVSYLMTDVARDNLDATATLSFTEVM